MADDKEKFEIIAQGYEQGTLNTRNLLPMLTLKELPQEERPREKLTRTGAEGLKDSELLAVIFGAGCRGRDILKVASDALPVIDGMWPDVRAEALEEVNGIGKVKAGQIVAALEFARRRIRPAGVKVSKPRDVMPLVQHLADRKQEHFVCISLNGAHEVIATRVLTIGLVNCTQTHPREVFSEPLVDRACAVIVAHNHPSGDLSPSKEDERVTKALKEAGELLGIKVLDHVIFSTKGFYSFEENRAIMY